MDNDSITFITEKLFFSPLILSSILGKMSTFYKFKVNNMFDLILNCYNFDEIIIKQYFDRLNFFNRIHA